MKRRGEPSEALAKESDGWLEAMPAAREFRIFNTLQHDGAFEISSATRAGLHGASFV